MRKVLALAFVFLMSQALAGESDSEQARQEGTQTATSAINFLKENLQNFTASISGQAKLKTFGGDEYSVSAVESSTGVDSINLQVVNGDLYVNIPGKISVYASAICENGFIHCDDETNWDKCSYYYYDKNTSTFQKGSFNDLVSCYCVSNTACGFRWDEKWLRWALDKVTYMLNLKDKNYVDMVAFPNAIRKFNAVQTTSITESQLKDTDSLMTKLKENEAVKAYTSNPYLASSNQEMECEIRNYLNSYGNTLHTKLVFLNGEDTRGLVCIGLEEQSPNTYKCYLASNVHPSCGIGWNYTICGSFGAEWYVPDDVGISFVFGDQIIKKASYHTDGDDWQRVSINSCDLQAGDCRVSCSGYACFGDIKFSPTDCTQISLALWNNGGCNGVPRGAFWTYVKEIPDISLSHQDTCGSIGESCKLKEEWVCFYPPTADYSGIDDKYCVKTVSNFVRNASVKPVCWQMKSSQLGQTWELCMDGNSITAISPSGEQIILGRYGVPKGWTYVKRVYYCPPDSGMNVDEAINRGLYVKEHAYYDQGQVGYSGTVECVRKTVGERDVYVCLANNQSYDSLSECQSNCYFDRAVTVPDSSFLTCKVGESEGVYLCKVAVPGHLVRVVNGDAEETNQQGETWDVNVKESEPNAPDMDSGVTYEFRTCELETDSSGNLVPKCPVSNGEQVVKDCYCDTTEEAWKVLATLETMNEMAHDIICSSSPP